MQNVYNTQPIQIWMDDSTKTRSIFQYSAKNVFLPGVIALEKGARKASNCHVGHCLICVRLKTQQEK